MQFGFFDDAAREYVITTPDTPMPWLNYLGNSAFFSLLSHRAGGYCFHTDARLRRLTRFRYNDIPADSNGRYLFVNDGGDVWSPSFAPVGATLDSYECRHGLGYTRITGTRGGVEVATLFLVPLDDPAELHQVTVTNHSDAVKELTLFSYLEFCLWDALDDQTNYQRNLSLAEVEVEGSTIYHTTEYRERRNHLAFYSVNCPIAGFDTDRDTFVGRWRPLAQAEVPHSGAPRNSLVSGWYPIGSHAITLRLEPGESRDLVFILGYAENPPEAKFVAPGVVRKDPARALLARYQTVAQVDAAMAALRGYWDSLLDGFQLRSADPLLDRSVNTWNPYQCMTTFNLSRSASGFETGIGRGMGFRDSNQDLLGIVWMLPERSRQRILDLAATQFPDGSAYHQYQPLTKRGNHALGSGFNDDPLWLIVGVCHYLKETGDWSILDEQVPFDNDPALAKPLLDHLIASYQYVVTNLGPHGLPLIGRADWNDCLNLNCFSDLPGESFQTTANRGDGRVAESVFIAGLFCYALPDLIAVLRNRPAGAGTDELALAAELEQALAAMTAAVDVAGWDGGWFRRAWDAFGEPVGSAANAEGQLYIEPQGMCVMAGLGVSDGRARRALDAVEARLASEHGIALLAPAYTSYHLELGEISSYPPGYKENGGIFCHNNPWVIIAETIAGSPERAFDYYRRITPAYREAISEVHGQEPYVYSQMIAGPEAPRHGQAKNSWLTGTAAWAYHAVTSWLLGVRPGLDGLVICPRMPSSAGDYEVTRRYRGATYHIRVIGSGTSAAGRLTVDGQPVDGEVVPVAAPGEVIEVVWSALRSPKSSVSQE
ncbi:MAG: hypothetical protein VB080_02060 [Propionicimonas sp.]|uniref:GH36-type glycosyl hydrolase domain-containing protein n=1 Tax=Propionicimonas sp. TaxID=1955623 RepID=UPI002B20E348|nr:hypothetical protein [Propionicimonas sp.]MEA4943201.1 hypothetical protein [Propionicimonas sp.]